MDKNKKGEARSYHSEACSCSWFEVTRQDGTTYRESERVCLACCFEHVSRLCGEIAKRFRERYEDDLNARGHESDEARERRGGGIAAFQGLPIEGDPAEDDPEPRCFDCDRTRDDHATVGHEFNP